VIRSARTTVQQTVAMMALTAPPVHDPAEGQMAMIASAWIPGTFTDPVAENLTGLPARVFHGETATPQVIVATPLLSQIDPLIGVSRKGSGRYPQLPSRRPPDGTPLP
jgi:hypothetical protein